MGAAVLAPAETGPGAWSIDAALRIGVSGTARIALLALGILGGVVALATPRIRARRSEALSR